MAGVYIHIPYCKVKCHYCDFHFSTQVDTRSDMLDALKGEILIRQNYLTQDDVVNTIYFGGGTPSFVPHHFISELVSEIKRNFRVAQDAEITLECNPDDITPKNLEAWKLAGVNRFSMGVQSFDDAVLKFMNRAHSAAEVYESILLAKKYGFENITVDLIYGIPNQPARYWQHQLTEFLKLDVPHLSAYCLTIEPKTVFGKRYQKGELQPAADDQSLTEFQYLMDFAKAYGYHQYEISNFGKSDFFSRHNSSYWLGEKYLGIGPSAHSYNLSQRGWNISNNQKYIEHIKRGNDFHEVEVLTIQNQCNDYLMTRLRTMWGINLQELQFIGDEKLADLKRRLENLVHQQLLVQSENTFCLTDLGKYRADGIAADLFID